MSMLVLTYGPAGFETSDWITLAVILAVFVLLGVGMTWRRRMHAPRR